MRISSRNMRAGLTIASLGIGCMTLGVAQASAQTSGASAGKLAYIRSQDIFAQAPGRADAESQFNGFVQTARAEEIGRASCRERV